MKVYRGKKPKIDLSEELVQYLMGRMPLVCIRFWALNFIPGQTVPLNEVECGEYEMGVDKVVEQYMDVPGSFSVNDMAIDRLAYSQIGYDIVMGVFVIGLYGYSEGGRMYGIDVEVPSAILPDREVAVVRISRGANPVVRLLPTSRWIGPVNPMPE